jgi:NAD(P)H-dependent FMN reductase
MNILAFAGSTRINSFNKIVIHNAVDYINEHYKYNVTLVDLLNYSVAIYDGDLENSQGLPKNALLFRELLKQHQIFLISSPEYNSSISGVLKNMIDWCSRPYNNEEELICFKEKIVILLSASPGHLGGIRGLSQLSSILQNIGCVILPFQLSIPNIHEEILNQQLSPKIQKMLKDRLDKNLKLLNNIVHNLEHH